MSVYALSDIHGFKSIYDQVKEFLEPEDQVIFLGDAADRGPNGWECIKAILDDPQFVYIMGNHDLFFIRSILGPDKMENRRLHFLNGGEVTLSAYAYDETLTEKEKIAYIERLAESPYYVECVNDAGKHIYLSHSGAVTHLGNKELDPEDFTWDREHFFEHAPEGIDLVVHGHTPIRHLIHSLNEYAYFFNENKMNDGSFDFIPGQPFFYAGWSKCDIDNCTILTGAATLLNLDTLEATAFFVQGEEKEFLWRK